MAGTLQNANSNDITSVISTLGQRAGSRSGTKVEAVAGPKRAAILMLARGEQYGRKTWWRLDDAERRQLSLEMPTVGPVQVHRG